MSGGETTLAQALFSTPELLLHRLDLVEQRCEFIRMTPASYRESPWLDARVSRADALVHIGSLRDVVEAYEACRPTLRPIRYIFHTSHCGSTALARCLESCERNLVLKEPPALSELSRARRGLFASGAVWAAGWPRLRDAIVALHGRTFLPEQTVIVKLTSYCHNLLSDLVGEAESALLLYADLESFMLAMYTENRAAFYLERYLPLLATDLDALVGPDRIRYDRLEQPERIAAMWLARIATFSRFMSEHPHARVAALAASDFSREPAAMLERITGFLDVEGRDWDARDPQLATILDTDAKRRPGQHDPSTRAAERARLRVALRRELRQGKAWAEPLLAEFPVPLPAQLR